jgi:hypothetical protein
MSLHAKAQHGSIGRLPSRVPSRWLDRWLARFSRNYALLGHAVDDVGRQLARRPYDAMLDPEEPLSFAQHVNGVYIDFDVEVFRIDNDGTMWVHVQSRSDLPTPLKLHPSLTFRKLPDGRAFIQL